MDGGWWMEVDWNKVEGRWGDKKGEWVLALSIGNASSKFAFASFVSEAGIIQYANVVHAVDDSPTSGTVDVNILAYAGERFRLILHR